MDRALRAAGREGEGGSDPWHPLRPRPVCLLTRRFFLGDQDFDLFGLPVDPGTGKPGRPAKVATAEDRNKIKLLMAQGWTVERMAPVVRMSVPTFRRNFFLELKERDHMRDRLYARRLEIAFRLADDGNVAALKELGKMLESSDRAFAEAELVKAQSKGGAEAPPIGKKDQARVAAKQAELSEGWGDDLKFSGRTRSH